LYDRTHSKLALGYVGLAQVVPVIALALPAGHVVDQYDRRRITIITQAAMIISAVGMTLTSFYHVEIDEHSTVQLSPILMYLCLLIAGFARAFQTPAKSALMTALVDKPHFSNAVMWNSGAFQAASIIGPIVAGFMIEMTHGKIWLVYAADTAMMLVLFVNLWMIRGKPFVPVKRAISLDSMMEGVKFVFRTKMILASITLDMFAVLLGGAVALLPVYAKDILHVGADGLGALQAAPAIGALMMGMIIAHRPPMKHAGRALLWAVAGFGLATIIFGFSTWYYLSLFMLFLTGAFDNVIVVVGHSLVHVLTPE
jgi:MFS family permease